MVHKVSAEVFLKNTFGGRPCQSQMHIYEGKLYECGCGMSHEFSEESIQVLRELPGMRYVFVAECGYATLIKMKGIFSVKFESEMSCSSEEMEKFMGE